MEESEQAIQERKEGRIVRNGIGDGGGGRIHQLNEIVSVS